MEEGKGGTWERNLRIINRRFPEVSEKLLSLPDDLELDERLIAGKRTVAILQEGGRKLRVQSVRPEIETRRWLDGQDLSPTVNVVLLGLGLGHPLKELFDRSDRRDFIAVVEKSPTLMRKALQMVDLTEPLSSPKVLLFLDEDRMGLFRRLRHQYQTIIANHVKCLSHPITFRIDQSYYYSMRRIVHDLYSWARANTTTLSKSGFKFTNNMLDNLTVFASSPGVSRLFNKFNRVPVVIVAAGPSLDKNLPYLRILKGRALIVAVDTIIKALMDVGIEPDMVVSIDFTTHTRRYFEGVDSRRLVLAFDPEVHPDVLKSYLGLKFAIDLEAKPIMDWARQFTGDKGLLPKGLSVAHTAFSLALEMGCDPIIFVGQDLAFSGGLSHAADALSVASSIWEDSGVKLEEVEGIHDKEVATSKPLLVFLRHFEELLEEVEATVIDATEGGARIKGTEIMTMREILANYEFPEVDVAGMLAEAGSAADEPDLSELLAGVRRLYRGVRKVRAESREVVKTMNRIEKELSAPRPENQTLNSLRRRWKNLIGEMREEKEVLPIIEYNIAGVMLKMRKREADTPDDWSDGGELTLFSSQIKRDRELFQEMEKSASSVEKGLRRLLERLGAQDIDQGEIIAFPSDD